MQTRAHIAHTHTRIHINVYVYEYAYVCIYILLFPIKNRTLIIENVILKKLCFHQT